MGEETLREQKRVLLQMMADSPDLLLAYVENIVPICAWTIAIFILVLSTLPLMFQAELFCFPDWQRVHPFEKDAERDSYPRKDEEDNGSMTNLNRKIPFTSGTSVSALSKARTPSFESVSTTFANISNKGDEGTQKEELVEEAPLEEGVPCTCIPLEGDECNCSVREEEEAAVLAEDGHGLTTSTAWKEDGKLEAEGENGCTEDALGDDVSFLIVHDQGRGVAFVPRDEEYVLSGEDKCAACTCAEEDEEKGIQEEDVCSVLLDDTECVQGGNGCTWLPEVGDEKYLAVEDGEKCVQGEDGCICSTRVEEAVTECAPEDDECTCGVTTEHVAGLTEIVTENANSSIHPEGGKDPVPFVEESNSKPMKETCISVETLKHERDEGCYCPQCPLSQIEEDEGCSICLEEDEDDEESCCICPEIEDNCVDKSA